MFVCALPDVLHCGCGTAQLAGEIVLVLQQLEDAAWQEGEIRGTKGLYACEGASSTSTRFLTKTDFACVLLHGAPCTANGAGIFPVAYAKPIDLVAEGCCIAK